jgi:hypothetical protein
MGVTEVKVNFLGFIGEWMALIYSYKMWGKMGLLFTIGLLLANGKLLKLEYTFRKK